MSLKPDTPVQRNASLVETSVGDEIVLMRMETGECFGLGETGSEIWRRLAHPNSATAIVDSLVEEYDAPAEQIQQDVLDLLEDLSNRGLVQPV
jgi:hypothetical protein